MQAPARPAWLRWPVRHRFALALPLLALPALWPLWKYGPPGTPDALVHFVRAGLLDYYVRHGILYPRWLSAAMLGRGYPSFNYYAPGSYYVAEALRLVGLSHYHAFMGAYALFVLLAGYGAYLLARDVFGPERPWPALAAAVAYMYAPYLLTNVYVRGAYAEAAAQVLVPWIFWSARRLMRAPRPSPYVLPAALSLGALAITHNVTLIFVPLPLLIYMAIHWRQSGGGWPRLAWAGAALALAMGVSAFFWLPLLLEQSFIKDIVPQIAAAPMLRDQAWRWHNFLDLNLVFAYEGQEPYQLGLAQAVVALAGFFAARRRDAEWLFFGLLAVAAGLMMGSWTLPLWYGNHLLLVAQFTWRLLSIMSLPLALLAGGILLPLRRAPWSSLAGAGLVALIIVANHPDMTGWGPLAPAGLEMTLASEAHAELAEPNLRGAAGLQEFTPRWVQDLLDLRRSSEESAAPGIDLRVLTANSHGLETRVVAAQGGPLRLGSYYFPGWQAVLDGRTPLKTYPSTNLGLLTVDVPPGEHTLRVTWAGTAAQRAGTLASLLALAALAALAWSTAQHGSRRWLAAPALALLLLGAGGTLAPGGMQPVEAPAEAAAAANVQLAGFRTEAGAGALNIYPYWHVTGPTPGTFRAHWRLLDAAGQVAGETVSWPYFGTAHANNWPPGTLQADAYTLALPAGLPAGTYQLTLQLGSTDEELARPPLQVGAVTLARPAPSGAAPPARPLDIAVGKDARLVGYDAGGPGPGADGRPPIVQPGQALPYTFYWEATRPILEDRHTLMDLVDRQGHRVTEVDQWAGPWFSPAMLWNGYRSQADTFLLRVPTDIPSGLYWPQLTLHDAKGQNQPMRDAAGAELGERLRLPPVKVVSPAPAPQHSLDVKLDQYARLTGYDLALPPAGLTAGSALTLTLYYRSTAVTDTDYSRFVHLASPSLGLAAQQDGPTQGGLNPVRDWQPGEVIREQVVLALPPQTQPGRYSLAVGFYPSDDANLRLPLYGSDGRALPDAQAVVADVAVR